MGNMLVNFAQWCIDAAANVGKTVVNLLPASPFTAYINISLSNDYLKLLNWMIPVSEIISLLESWCVAIGLWYLYQIILRWVKVVE